MSVVSFAAKVSDLNQGVFSRSFKTDQFANKDEKSVIECKQRPPTREEL